MRYRVLRLRSFRRNRGAHWRGSSSRAEGFNCDRRTGDFLRSLDPHAGAVLRRRGSSSFHRVRRKSPFFSFFAVPPPLRGARSSFCARRRPRDPMPRGHVSASNILLPLHFLPHFLYAPTLRILFSLAPSFPSLWRAAWEFLEDTYSPSVSIPWFERIPVWYFDTLWYFWNKYPQESREKSVRWLQANNLCHFCVGKVSFAIIQKEYLHLYV